MKFLKRVLMWAENHFIVVLIVGAIITMALSMVIGLMQSVWFDEAYSIMLAKQPIAQLLHLTSVDTHPPVYYLLLKLWGSTFGWSEVALRSLSVLSLGGATIFAGLVVKRTFGVRAALVSLAFVVLSPFLIRYGFEIRMYALASFIGIAATYILIRATESKRPTWSWILYGLLVALGVYTLYYTALLWIAHVVWLVWRARQQKQSIIKTPWFKAYLLAVIIFLPWLSTFIHQIFNGALAPIAQSMTVDNLIGIISFSFIYRPLWQVGPWLSLVIVFVLIMMSYLSVRAFKLANKSQRSYLMLFALYIIVPVAVLTLVGLAHPFYVERYLAHVLIGGSIFLGVSSYLVFSKASRRLKILIGIFMLIPIIGIIQLVSVGNYNFQRLEHPQVKQVAATIPACSNKVIILAGSPYSAIELQYYMPTCVIHFYNQTATMGGGYAELSNSPYRTDDPAKDFQNAQAVYYVYYGQSQLTMPSSMQRVSHVMRGSLSVDQFDRAHIINAGV